MSKIKFSGPFSLRLSSFLAINKIALATYARHALGRRLERTWDAHFEIGIRFWRHQFTKALAMDDIDKGRALFDSLQTETDDHYAVRRSASDSPKGVWHHPETRSSAATLLYLHGGGYTFHGAVSHRYADMLAHHSGAQLFAPDYRLTPEHPHPAQSDDAFAAWQYLRETVPAKQIVVIGDSAGGHMALSLLQRLKIEGEPQPALCIGLCPWTDIGDRGASLHGNDSYDLVQGWMALRFGEWLDPKGTFGRLALSPIAYDYNGLAPIYLQAGGREILRDMIRDFARAQAAKGADILLDLWSDMAHNFQALDSTRQSSTEALQRICAAVEAFAGAGPSMTAGPATEVCHGAVFSCADHTEADAKTIGQFVVQSSL